ncbi:MAG: hypothetical protein KDJ37_13995 [Hyphomicrobiaceae bacterium]|nr:hypothetical protein [Hyphomicrobiaceae bacterium]
MDLSVAAAPADIQIFIAIATATLIALVWIAPASLVAAAHEAIAGLFIPQPRPKSKPHPQVRAPTRRAAPSHTSWRPAARKANRPGLRDMVRPAAPTRVAISECKPVGGTTPGHLVSHNAGAVLVQRETQRLDADTQWRMLATAVGDRIVRVGNATQLQRRAAEQLDAAAYGFDRLIAELATVMPNAGREPRLALVAQRERCPGKTDFALAA